MSSHRRSIVCAGEQYANPFAGLESSSVRGPCTRTVYRCAPCITQTYPRPWGEGIPKYNRFELSTSGRTSLPARNEYYEMVVP